MLVYIKKSYTAEKHLKTSNIGLDQFISVKINMPLIYNSIKNTQKAVCAF